MPKKGANISLSSYDDIFETDASRAEAKQERIQSISILDLVPFENHPFKVVDDEAMLRTTESIAQYGVLTPIIARPLEDGGYEIISGHRRVHAAEAAGLDEVPVIVRDMTDDEATVLMVDSNLQRESILPSERAFAYKMKLEAMKRQGVRTDLTSSQAWQKSTSSQVVTETSDQDGPELYNPTTKAYALQSNYDVDGNWCITQGDMISSSFRSDELLAKQVGENRMTIQRYIRLTNLIPKVLDMVDEGKIAFTIAVELSYLTEEQQYELYEVMDIEQCTPSLSQANRMKRMSQSESLDMDAMFSILEQEKPNQREQIKLRTDSVAKYFPEDYTPKQKTDLIERLLKEWYEKQEREKKQGSDSSRGRAR